MTEHQKDVLWWMVNDQADGMTRDDVECLCEQWWAEIEWPDLTI